MVGGLDTSEVPSMYVNFVYFKLYYGKIINTHKSRES